MTFVTLNNGNLDFSIYAITNLKLISCETERSKRYLTILIDKDNFSQYHNGPGNPQWKFECIYLKLVIVEHRDRKDRCQLIINDNEISRNPIVPTHLLH